MRSYSAPVPHYPAGARTASAKHKRTRPQAMPTAVRILNDALRIRWPVDRLDFLINAETTDIKSTRSCPANTNITFPVRKKLSTVDRFDSLSRLFRIRNLPVPACRATVSVRTIKRAVGCHQDVSVLHVLLLIEPSDIALVGSENAPEPMTSNCVTYKQDDCKAKFGERSFCRDEKCYCDRRSSFVNAEGKCGRSFIRSTHHSARSDQLDSI